LDRLENTVLRLKEEERALRVLLQEETLGSLSEETWQQPASVEGKPGKPILRRAYGALEDVFKNAQFHAGLSTGVTYNDNVHSAREDTKGDWAYTVSPSWNLKLTRGQSYLGVNYSYNYNYYLKHSSPASEGQGLGIDLFYKPSPIFSLGLTESFSGASTLDLFKIAPLTIDRFNRAHHRITGNALSTTFTYMPWGRTNLAHLNFADSRAYSEDRFLTSSSQSLGVDIQHYLNPITSVYLGLGLGRTANEEEEETNNSNSRYINLGLGHDLTRITKAGVGLSFHASESAAGVYSEDYSFNCNLSHKISNSTGISGSYDYYLPNTASGDYRRSHTSTYSFSLNHQFMQKLSMALGTTYVLSDYLKQDYIGTDEAIGKERKSYNCNFGLSYPLYKWLNLNFSYRHSRTLSDFPDEDYANNVYSWGATFNF
jgi:hypothetical protein